MNERYLTLKIIMMNKKIIFIALAMAFFQVSCKKEKAKNVTEPKVNEVIVVDSTLLKAKDFEASIDKKETHLYWIENNGIKAAFTNYGGRIIGLWMKDKNDKVVDVVIGMNSVSGFQKSTEPYFGATIGRVGNRIAKGKFSLEGKQYQISLNNHGNALHGGIKGFQDVVWDAKRSNDSTLIFTYNSLDSEQGFPGNVKVKVTYTLTSSKTLKMEYEATTDKTTIVNLTNHAFFNLNGEGSGTILNHKLQIFANEYTPVDSGLIPTGKLEKVANTPFDFTTKHTIGERVKTENEQLKFGGGYDHNYALNAADQKGIRHAATISGDKSGVVMDIYTVEPGLQFYSGNFMQSKNTLKSGKKDHFRTAFALETQHFPDAPNHANFEPITLKAGEKYLTVSEYKFSILK